MATTITKDSKEITFVGSPQYITATDVYLPAQADNFYISIRIWHGDKTAIPVDATIERFLPAVFVQQDESGYETKVSFEISKFIEGYINSDEYVSSEGTIPYNEEGAVWYNYTVSATGSGGGNLPVTSTTKLATTGRGLISEGSNPGTTIASENDKIFGNHSSKLIVDPNGKYVIPIYIGDTSTNAFVVANNTLLDLSGLGVVLNSADSSRQIAYIPLNDLILSSEWVVGGNINISITSSGSGVLRGMSFDGISTYMDLGIVPLLNSADSYIKLNYKATNWKFNIPFGYSNSTPDIFQIYRAATTDEFRLLNNPIVLNPAEYPNTDNYQEFYVYETITPDPILAALAVEIGGNLINGMEDVDYTRRDYSGIPFYLGARNSLGVADEFTSVIFTSAEFFNGVELKVFNDANNWGGAVNYGGVEVISYDEGATWVSPPNYNYTINIECSKGEPMVLKYVNLHGAVDTIPVNGINKQSLTTTKTNYQNNILDSEYNYDPLRHMDKTFVINGKTKFTIGTGWMYEESNTMIEELMVSKNVWLETSDGNYPVQIDDKSKQLINRTWTNQFDYSFNVTVATSYLNDIQ